MQVECQREAGMECGGPPAESSECKGEGWEGTNTVQSSDFWLCQSCTIVKRQVKVSESLIQGCRPGSR